jgi:hypothetical protein
MKIRSPNARIAELDFVTRPIRDGDPRLLEPCKIALKERGHPVFVDKRGRIHGAYVKGRSSACMVGEPFELMNGSTDQSPMRLPRESLRCLVKLGVITEDDAREHLDYIAQNYRARRELAEITAFERLVEMDCPCTKAEAKAVERVIEKLRKWRHR